MANAKIEVKVGAVTFSGEGEAKWLETQLEKILGKVADLTAIAPPVEANEAGDGPTPQRNGKTVGSLAQFINSKNIGKSQVKRFLTTAQWLHLKGQDRVKTGDVAKALRNAHQSKLSNPSDCLNKNVSKGFCEKDGESFFVTEDGRREVS